MSKYLLCSICGKAHVKLWRLENQEPAKPGTTTLLFCASCAEERQFNPERYECVWKKTRFGYGYIGVATGKKLPSVRWEIDEAGRIPNYSNPIESTTDRLKIEFYGDVFTLIPAVLMDCEYRFYSYPKIPKENYKEWTELPTR